MSSFEVSDVCVDFGSGQNLDCGALPNFCAGWLSSHARPQRFVRMTFFHTLTGTFCIAKMRAIASKTKLVKQPQVASNA
ncbi:MAG: hypothetical protein MJ183_09815 [Treponemataceae bacterium]|nr:hypothetical protein [Treponemataceae bacterium]